MSRRRSRSAVAGALVAAVAAAPACSKPVTFSGQSTLAIVGTPPKPPPPPTPAKPAPRVEVRENKIEIHEKIQFDDDKATIKPVSFDLLGEIAAVIQKNPQIKKLRVEGYASSEGDAAHNLRLSDERAKAVMKYLVDHGISKGELVAQGFGSERPIADNATEEGREQNRRVEFVILEQDVTEKKVEIDPDTGKEKVLDEHTETVKASDAGAPAPAGGKAKGGAP